MNLSIRLLTIFRSLTASNSSSICDLFQFKTLSAFSTDTCVIIIEETVMKTITVMIMTMIIIMMLMVLMMMIMTMMTKTMTTTTMTHLRQ